MNPLLTRTTLAATSMVLITGCGTGTRGDAAPRTVTQDQPDAVAGATYDGWLVRAQWDDAFAPCPWSPDQIQRMMDSGQPLPACVRRLQRWFQQEYDPS